MSASNFHLAKNEWKNKTVITMSGETLLWKRFLPGLSGGTPTEAVEWKRSFGRAPKTVNLEAEFVPFDVDTVMNKQDKKRLMDVPVLHTFWVECQDLDSYKAFAKEEILQWLGLLRKCGIAHDWLVVVVEATDSKKTNKLLPRTSVLDKVKTDTGTKQPERCISLIDPTRNDSRAAESWQNLLHRIRLLTLQAYNRILGRFEDNMRSQRERRNEINWNFCEYFLVQEELAFVYEMLGIYDEALVQYDELDALFTQFVLNSNVTECPDWLQIFQSKASHWSGLSLNPKVFNNLRDQLAKKEVSLIDLRNYLFSRQCHLLLKVHKPWEVAKRSLPFLHNCVQEISILEISYPEGSQACWIFLSCLEILQTCEKYSDSSNKIQYYCLFTASLWTYAREKLFELGQLCGLMPNMTPNSEQLHKFVELSSGINNYEGTDGSEDPEVFKGGQEHEEKVLDSLPGSKCNLRPVDRLREALSSKANFQKHYLELSELAISTFKHIGRIRSARCIGIELAKFYLLLGQIPQAVTFLLDAIKTFQAEGWRSLELQTLKEIADCYRKLNEKEKLARTLVKIMSFIEEQPISEHKQAFNEFFTIVNEFDSEISCEGTGLIKLVEIKVEKTTASEKIILGSNVTYKVTISSDLPGELDCDDVRIALHYSEPKRVSVQNGKEKISLKKSLSSETKAELKRMSSSASSGRSRTSSTSLSSNDACDFSGESEVTPRLLISEQLDFKQDKNLSSVRLLCKNAAQVLRRKDSSGVILKDIAPTKAEDSHCLTVPGPSTHLAPGINHLNFTGTAGPIGTYTPRQLVIKFAKLQLLLDLENCAEVAFSPVHETPTMAIDKTSIAEGDYHAKSSDINNKNSLKSGQVERVKLSLFTGSCVLNEPTSLEVKCLRGLKGCHPQREVTKVRDEKENEESVKLSQNFEIAIPPGKAFETIEIEIFLEAEIPILSQKTTNLTSGNYIELIQSSSEHRLIISDIWTDPVSERTITLPFSSPFLASYRVNTSRDKKFVEIRLYKDEENKINNEHHPNHPPTAANKKENVLFQFQNPKLEVEKVDKDKGMPKFKLVNDLEPITELSCSQDCTFFFQLVLPEDKERPSPDFLKLSFHVDYRKIKRQQHEPKSSSSWTSLSLHPELKDYKTLYALSSRVLPAKGGEVCRAATICCLTLELEQLNETEHDSLMYEVLADQAVWAVCGRAAAVIDMSAMKNQSVSVEVMPLVGGHLLLPKIRISKYLPAQGTGLPKLEPFSAGQIYNSSRLTQIHVLAPPSSSSSGNPVYPNSPSSSHSIGPIFGFGGSHRSSTHGPVSLP